MDNGGGVGVGVTVTVVCSTESREADRLPARKRLVASVGSFSGSASASPSPGLGSGLVSAPVSSSASAPAVGVAVAEAAVASAAVAVPSLSLAATPSPPTPTALAILAVPGTLRSLNPSALLPAHCCCTGRPRPTVSDSYFCLPLFFFFRLKKQQHLEMKRILVSSIMSTSCGAVIGVLE